MNASPGTNSSLLAYDDVRDILERALASEKGIAMRVETNGMAVRLRQRIYSFRRLMRDESTRIYKLGDPMFGRTPYDGLVIPQWEGIEGVPDVLFKIVKQSTRFDYQIEDL